MLLRRLVLLFMVLTSAALAPARATQALSVLSNEDAALYTEIFALQENASWKAADRKIAALSDKTLMGYVRYQRLMHPTGYRASYRELKEWMAYYADHPEAHKIYALARKRRPRGQAAPVRPIPRQWRSDREEKALHPDILADYERTGRARLRKIEGRVRYLTGRERAMDALDEIENHLARKRITTRQFDRMRSWIAASLYYQGYVDTADKIAHGAKRNGESAVLAYWIAGLIDYRRGDDDSAFDAFQKMAAIPYQEDSLRAAAGFWAARTALATGRPEAVTPNLQIAAALPFTFYGQLAMAQLGKVYDYNWQAPAFSDAGLNALREAAPRIDRAIALRQAGKKTEADIELRWANGEIPNALDGDLLALASSLSLPAAQIDIALAGEGRHLEAGLYPIPDYAPRNGFAVDRALIYALMRQESKFKTEATSRVGARGLMQLMPRTASYIAKDRTLRYRKGRDRLYDPAFNIELGQNYVSYLIDGAADGDLFHLAAAYNGGPGNLRRWKNALDIDDPLLFIESIPNRESRNFVEVVLTNFWIYRDRLGQPSPSRERVASGDLPLYEALDQIAEGQAN